MIVGANFKILLSTIDTSKQKINQDIKDEHHQIVDLINIYRPYYSNSRLYVIFKYRIVTQTIFSPR